MHHLERLRTVPRAARRSTWARAAAVALALIAGAVPLQQALAQADEAPAARTSSPELATAERHMVSAANGYAAEAGREILRAGGSAVDAAIATQLVLNLVEPQSSGIGGGAFILYWDAGKRELKAYDGRETAPASARPDRFLVDGKPMPFNEAVRSGLSVGVPGLVRLLEMVHAKHGRLPWARLFEPALRLADEGFEVSQRLHYLLRWHGPSSFVPAARSYFFTETGNAWPIGYQLKNPAFAATLRRIAAEGARGFYEGPVAEAIVAAVATAPVAPGGMTLADLAGYTAKERQPVCTDYRGDRICGMGPPSSGGYTVAQTMKLIERFDLGGKSGARCSPGRCISSRRPRSSPSPTATATSPTPIS